MHFGPSSVKLIASQCLLELLTRISDKRISLNAELQCSVKYLKSVIAVIEGLVFSEDSKVADNCGACLSLILGWEKFGMQENMVVRESKWFRLIMEEFAVSLTSPGLTSKYFTNKQKFAAKLAVSLLKLTHVPDWLTSLFDNHLISGVVANLSPRIVTPEIVILFGELMARKFLSQDDIAVLHNLFQLVFSSEKRTHAEICSISEVLDQIADELSGTPANLYLMLQVCRRQIYEGSSKAQLSEPKVKKMVRSTDGMLALLHDLMLDQSADLGTIQTEQQKLRREIDLFFQESSGREQF
ncbi:hypothetical protein PR202_gb26109 [Eleusine coracana subsp. coracana]|uniref:Uncharacterized protein n=1 Tax=Eleusine coracana subsp. coracana TaxID=191504 RepID=A0AAV5FRB5_ELECO|nr:hypothetical protein PR202_gb26109 [Eleusine coracana subsp. coracana]